MTRATAFACGYKNKLGVIGPRMYHRWLALTLARLDFRFSATPLMAGLVQRVELANQISEDDCTIAGHQ
jgi:hypothetical protein